jgi:hypothetical protein
MATVNTLSAVLWLRVPPAPSSSMLARVACNSRSEQDEASLPFEVVGGGLLLPRGERSSAFLNQRPRRETGKARKSGPGGGERP